MKKIILAFDGTHFSEGAFEFARKLDALEPILLTGVFLPQAELANLWSYAYGLSGPLIPLVEKSETDLIQMNIDKFEKLCWDNTIEFTVHKDFYDFALPELKRESRFADLLILGSEVFYKNIGTGQPNDYLKDALHEVSCPVLLVPEKYEFPESIILAYDGSEASIFAIKQFAYLFPEMLNRQTMLIYAHEDAQKDFPEKRQIEELVSRHYKNLTLFKLDINPKKLYSAWVAENNSAILVCGSYSRSGLSEFFRRSFVQDVIADHHLPVFIAHR